MNEKARRENERAQPKQDIIEKRKAMWAEWFENVREIIQEG